MKVYMKPAIEFIELKPEERLACNSTHNSGGGCGSNQNSSFFNNYNWLQQLIAQVVKLSNQNNHRGRR